MLVAYQPGQMRDCTTPTARPRERMVEWQLLASHAEESHLRVLLKPCVNLSIHTASDVRQPTLKNRQWGKSVGLARRTRANHCLAPLERPRRRLNFRLAQRIR
jgi:hypothetical protein